MKSFKKQNRLPEHREIADPEALRAEVAEACHTVFAQEGRRPDSTEVRRLVRANHVIINRVIESLWPTAEADLPETIDTDKLTTNKTSGADSDIKQMPLDGAAAPNAVAKREKVRVKVRKYDGEG